MKKLLLITGLLVVLLASWMWLHFVSSFDEPVFVTVKDIKVMNVTDKTAGVSATVVFNNPNPISAILLNTELKAYSNDVQVGHISQTHISSIAPASDFEIPLSFNIDILKLGMSQGLSGVVESLLNEEKVLPVKFEGYCRIKNKEEIYKIPIVYEDKLVFK